MFDDIRRVGEKIDNLLGVDIFPFNYPFSHTENFLQNLEKWEFSIPMNFLWLVRIDVNNSNQKSGFVPNMINSGYMWMYEAGDAGQHAGAPVYGPTRRPAGHESNGKGWDINQSKREITRDAYMSAGQGKSGCILAQGVVIPGENYNVEDLAINNNMGFIPGKVGGNRQPLQPLTIEFRETNRSFPDTVLRPWIILASHMGLVARPDNDYRNIKCNITLIQLAKTYQYIPHLERKIFRFYNCVPTRLSSHELTHQDGQNLQLYSSDWAYTHYTVESLPDMDVGDYMGKEGFKKFVKDMATKLLSRTKLFKKISKGLAKVERFVDKANKIKKKVNKVLGFLGGMGKSRGGPAQSTTREMAGSRASDRFITDERDRELRNRQ